jgi:hypothetical protein
LMERSKKHRDKQHITSIVNGRFGKLFCIIITAVYLPQFYLYEINMNTFIT